MDTICISGRPCSFWGLTKTVWSGKSTRSGPRTSLVEGRINYKKLRVINPEAARRGVVEYLKTNKGNISQAARLFGINRAVIYDIVMKDREEDLRDRSKSSKH